MLLAYVEYTDLAVMVFAEGARLFLSVVIGTFLTFAIMYPFRHRIARWLNDAD
jgi:hypothetical protein